ncbi:hypothetical protein BFP70_16570 [Thioclava sp. SK-1]|uniref:hypothetical protein n=1 Tax=Thioclava sp. SK-1 TaxID=1889770 RepID=UPI000825A700|nr:hypothetical protein [Thioclava sp. SK-1]OCX61064.1 hypothetical protein BFP70_16570 [Thioclava sp. SK-1]
MENLVATLGILGLAALVISGALAGWIASLVAGRNHRMRYIAIGILGAVAIPFLIAALGVGALAAGGAALMVSAAIVGSLIVLAIGKLIFD